MKKNPRSGKTPAKPRSSYDRALGLLARREHSARELKAKLAARAGTREEAGDVVEQLTHKDLQSDTRFGGSLARQRCGQGYGPRRIQAELRSHGLSDAEIRVAIAELDADWATLAAAQLRRRYGTRAAADHEERGVRAAFLLRRGFDPATVRAVTRAEVDDPGEELD